MMMVGGGGKSTSTGILSFRHAESLEGMYSCSLSCSWPRPRLTSLPWPLYTFILCTVSKILHAAS